MYCDLLLPLAARGFFKNLAKIAAADWSGAEAKGGSVAGRNADPQSGSDGDPLGPGGGSVIETFKSERSERETVNADRK